jgi:ABC-type uncharacterized transport system involved in gliding motility auxiliary subunit
MELVRTSDQGWGETNLADLQAVKKDPDDRPGPVSIAVAVAPVEPESDAEAGDGLEDATVEEESVDEEAADASAAAAPDASAGATTGAAAPAAPAEPAAPRLRLVVIGDSDFATNAQLANAGNPTLLANTVNWLVERQQALGIPPKAPEEVRLTLSASQLSTIFWLVAAVLPLAAVTAGVGVYLRRRR